MKKVILIFILLQSIVRVHAVGYVDHVRGLDFGIVTYSDSSTGVTTITVPSSQSSPTTSGSGGHMTNATFPAGTGSRCLVYLDGFDAGSKQKLNARVNTSSATKTTQGCGTVTISDVNLWTTKPESAKGKTTATLAVGANLQLTNYTGTTTCTITGVLQGAVGWKLNSASSWSNTDVADIDFTFTIIGPTNLAHNPDSVLDFGTFCRTGQQQTLTVNPDGTVGSYNMVCAPTAVSADSFTFSNPTSVLFSVSFPASATLTNGTDTFG